MVRWENGYTAKRQGLRFLKRKPVLFYSKRGSEENSLNKCSVRLNANRNLLESEGRVDSSRVSTMAVHDSNSLCFWWRFTLVLSICNVVFTIIHKRCLTIEEHLLREMPKTPNCYRYPGKGLYADCNIINLRTDLSEVGLGVRSLCIVGDISSIPADAFSHVPLEVLQIDGKRLERVQSGAFSALPNLKCLSVLINDAICRSISTMESLAFTGLNNSEELTLRRLKLECI